jgi:hypothetical protein
LIFREKGKREYRKKKIESKNVKIKNPALAEDFRFE